MYNAEEALPSRLAPSQAVILADVYVKEINPQR